jgi:hypothetical protein
MLSFSAGQPVATPLASNWIDIASVASVCGTFFQASRTFLSLVLASLAADLTLFNLTGTKLAFAPAAGQSSDQEYKNSDRNSIFGSFICSAQV